MSKKKKKKKKIKFVEKEFNPYTDRPPEESYQKFNIDRFVEKLNIAAQAAERCGRVAKLIQEAEDRNGGLVF